MIVGAVMTALLALAIVACGAEASELQAQMGMEMSEDSAFGAAGAAAGVAAEASAEVMEVVVEKEVIKEVVVEKVVSAPIPAAMAMSESASAGGTGSGGLTKIQAQAAAQQRVIVHTANLSLVVDHIQESIDYISGVAADSGGWVVSSSRDKQHGGFISIRVPSQGLAGVTQRLRDWAGEVQSEVITSEDVTDEYVDLNSRLTNEQRTEAALIGILERAQQVEDALNVQRELSSVQENIERLQGRIRFLQETSAFSLVTVDLTLAAGDMQVDAGGDRKVSTAEPARFRATFRPPKGIDEFRAVWDFGDGSDPVTVRRSAPSGEPGQRWTATVHHQYPDTKDSPYIVSVEVTGTGEAGIAKGEDSLTLTVLEFPKVEVFAGDHQTVRQGSEVKFSGSFTRPAGLKNVRFEWDPGDGSAPVEQALGTGETRAAASHVYQDYRSEPYRAVLTVIADSEVGEVRESGEILVWVEEEPGFVVGGLEVGGAFKDGVRAFTAVVQVLFIALIWLLIFSPVWIVAGGAWWLWRRRWRRARAERTAAEAEGTEAEAGSAA